LTYFAPNTDHPHSVFLGLRVGGLSKKKVSAAGIFEDTKGQIKKGVTIETLGFASFFICRYCDKKRSTRICTLSQKES
jgi:hypothetical protein